MGFFIVYFKAVDVDAEVTLITLLLINTTAIVKTIPRIIQMKSIRLNNKKSLNELILEGGYAVIYQDFCGISEFSSAGWAQSRGC